jgi:hypothetical protein
LPVRRLCDVDPCPPERRWLIEQLWVHAGVGILGGGPKLGKTYLAAELSLAVACGGTALARFPARTSGPVLFFGAEDSLPDLRTRFDGLLALRQLTAAEVPIHLIDVPVLRLDRERDLGRLQAAIDRYRPRLLVLDPFVRITAIDENSAAEVSAVLASLRQLQREFELAIIVVHHARKSPAAHPAQTFRGSGDFAAWSDTNLCLSRRGKHVDLFVEHRSAPAPEPLALRLEPHPAPHLVLLNAATVTPDTGAQADGLQAELLRHLTHAAQPMTTLRLRELLGRRKVDVIAALEGLRALGRVRRTAQGWSLTDDEQ